MSTTVIRPDEDRLFPTAYWSTTSGTLAAAVADESNATFASCWKLRSAGSSADAQLLFADTVVSPTARVSKVTFNVRHIRVGFPINGSLDPTNLAGFSVTAQVFDNRAGLGERVASASRVLDFTGLTTDTSLVVVLSDAVTTDQLGASIQLKPPRNGLEFDQTSSGARFMRIDAVVEWFNDPTVTVTGPTGTLTNTTRPTVTWAVSSEIDQAEQTLRVFTRSQATNPGFDVLTTLPVYEALLDGNVRSHRVAQDLDNREYVAYVQSRQVVGAQVVSSAWASSSTFTVAVSPPDTPVAEDVVEPSSGGRLIFEWRFPVSDLATTLTETFEVERALGSPNGEWRRLASDIPKSPNTALYAIVDHRVPQDGRAFYRVRSVGSTAEGRIASEWSATLFRQMKTSTPWLKIAGADGFSNPNIAILPASEAIPAAVADRAVGRHLVLGASQPVVTYDALQSEGRQFTLRCWTLSEGERNNLDVVISSDGPLLTQFPPDYGEPDRWAVLTNHSRERVPGALVDDLVRLEVLTFVQVAEPAFPPIEESYIFGGVS